MRRNKAFRRALIAVAMVAVIPVGILLYQAALRADGNFHEVLPGQFYRAAQLSPDALASYVKQHDIKTILNLRGTQPDEVWYRDESRISQASGAKLIDFPMSASKQMTREKALELVALMKAAPKPILVHCKTGADRTGLVSVIYANQVAGMDEETAEEQLAPIYGHFGIPFFSPTFAMDESWEDFEKLFGIEGS